MQSTMSRIEIYNILKPDLYIIFTVRSYNIIIYVFVFIFSDYSVSVFSTGYMRYGKCNAIMR